MLLKGQIQNKWTLESVNKYECNTGVSYMKSLITAFENFLNVKSLLIIFTKLVTFTKKLCCLHRPIEYVFAFSNDNTFFGDSHNCHLIDNVEISEILPWLLENQHHPQKPVLNKVIVWIGLVIMFDLMWQFSRHAKNNQETESQITLW